MATVIFGLLALGFKDSARDFDAIMAGLYDEFDAINNWSVDWSQKITWPSTGTTPLIENNPNPLPKNPTNDVEIRAAFAHGSTTNLTSLATYLVGLTGPQLDHFIGTSTPAIKALKDQLGATPTRGLIMAFTGDPVTAGIYTSDAARGKITGIIDHVPAQAKKQVRALQLLLAAWGGGGGNPRIAIIHNKNNQGKTADFNDLKTLIGTNRVLDIGVALAAELTPDALASHPDMKRADAAVVMGDPLTSQNAASIRAYFDARKIPVIFGAPEAADSGALMACGPSHRVLFRRAASFVKRMAVDGTAPETIPLERPNVSDVRLILNQKTREAWKQKDFPRELELMKDGEIR